MRWPIHSRRAWFVTVIGALVVASCGSSSTSSSAPSSAQSSRTSVEEQPFAVEQAPPSVKEAVLSGLNAVESGSSTGLPDPTVPLSEMRSGGPPPDGIPAIDEPKFLRPGDVDFLGDTEPVLVVEIGGEARAYPVQILMWHEIVNDTISGIPIAVTYCPLCNSAVAYDRRVGKRVLTFGTSGMLWNSALVMYDRQTETLWSHFTGEGIIGILTGVELTKFSVATVPWRAWREAHPDGLVLSRSTGFTRDYGSNPYPGYDDVNATPFLFEGEVDGRFTAMTRVIGIERNDAAVAVPLVELRDQRVVRVQIAGQDLTVWWVPGTNSALDAGRITGGNDIGATGVFVPIADSQNLTFIASGDRFVDDQTGSTWNLFGRATSGPLSGRQLESVVHVDTFWFAWAVFQPDTEVTSN